MEKREPTQPRAKEAPDWIPNRATQDNDKGRHKAEGTANSRPKYHPYHPGRALPSNLTSDTFKDIWTGAAERRKTFTLWFKLELLKIKLNIYLKSKKII